MTSTFTTNKGIEKPASGDYVNAWAAPVNADWDDIDTALGGTTSISVTSVVAGTYSLTLTQYRPPNIEFTGTLSANLNYQIPAGVGGIWTLSNATTGSFTLTFSIASGNSIALSSGRTLIVSDGVNISVADSTRAPYLSGSFTATLTSSGGGAGSASVSCAYNVIGSVVSIWKTDGSLVTVLTGSLGTLFLTGIPALIMPTHAQISSYVNVVISGVFYEAASAISGSPSSTISFATLGISSGWLQRNPVGFPLSSNCGLSQLFLTYPLA